MAIGAVLAIVAGLVLIWGLARGIFYTIMKLLWTLVNLSGVVFALYGLGATLVYRDPSLLLFVGIAVGCFVVSYILSFFTPRRS